jgi:DNA-binding MarR family transcriptional regulator
MNHSSPLLNHAIATQVPSTCMGLHIRRASRILTQAYDAALRPTGLAVNQFTLLVAIYLSEPVSITQLAEGLFSDQTTTTRNVKLLEKQGLVATSPGSDRRIKLVSLTSDGKVLLDKALPLWEQVQAELKHQFGDQKWQALLSLLAEVTVLS